ncbi:Hypothetical protein SMAX5B_004886, partial [Scophthalmus maximus]
VCELHVFAIPCQNTSRIKPHSTLLFLYKQPCETTVESSAFLLTPRPLPFVFRKAPPRSSLGLLRSYGVALP